MLPLSMSPACCDYDAEMMRKGLAAAVMGKLTVFLAAVLFLDYVLLPIDDLAVLFFLDGDVCHGCGRRRTVPVPFVWGKPDDIAGMDLFDWTAFALCPSTTGGHNERLTERMCMPGGACARLERHAGAGHERRVRSGKERIDPDGAGEPVCWPFG